MKATRAVTFAWIFSYIYIISHYLLFSLYSHHLFWTSLFCSSFCLYKNKSNRSNREVGPTLGRPDSVHAIFVFFTPYFLCMIVILYYTYCACAASPLDIVLFLPKISIIWFLSIFQNSFQYQCSLARQCIYSRTTFFQVLKPPSNLFCSISFAWWTTCRTPEISKKVSCKH